MDGSVSLDELGFFTMNSVGVCGQLCVELILEATVEQAVSNQAVTNQAVTKIRIGPLGMSTWALFKGNVTVNRKKHRM